MNKTHSRTTVFFVNMITFTVIYYNSFHTMFKKLIENYLFIRKTFLRDRSESYE